MDPTAQQWQQYCNKSRANRRLHVGSTQELQRDLHKDTDPSKRTRENSQCASDRPNYPAKIVDKEKKSNQVESLNEETDDASNQHVERKRKRLSDCERKVEAKVTLPLSSRGGHLKTEKAAKTAKVLKTEKAATAKADAKATATNAREKQTQTQRKHQPDYTTHCFPGINIRWPFSQLILSGVKTVEVREYALGHMHIAHANVEMWLVETVSSRTSSPLPLLIEGVCHVPLVNPPPYAQIVGTVTFSDVEQGSRGVYENYNEFEADARKHCMVEWPNNVKLYRWRVSAFRRVSFPIKMPGNKSGTGFRKPRSFHVEFE